MNEEFMPENSVEKLDPFKLGPEDAVKQLEVVEQLQKKMAMVVLKRTTRRDWFDVDGTPVLAKRGCDLARSLAWLSVKTAGARQLNQVKKEDSGQTYEEVIFECHGTVSSPWGPDLSCVGVCSSFDPMFEGQLPVNKAHVASMAHTRCVLSGVRSYLRLTGLTWQDIIKLTPLTEKDVIRIKKEGMV